MFHRFTQRARRVHIAATDWQHDPDYRAARALARKVLAPILIVFGLALLNPFFNTFTTSNSWSAMAGLSDGYEWPWGLCFCVVGVALETAFTAHRFEITTTLCAMLAYASIALLFLPTGYTGTGPWIYGTLAVACYFVLINLFRALVWIEPAP